MIDEFVNAFRLPTLLLTLQGFHSRSFVRQEEEEI